MEKSSNDNCSSHSWWLDSHNRPPHQSLWLQSTLSEFSTKIKTMVSLMEDDGDTFAKRAEMFYQRRPQLIQSLKDLHNSFCTLADKYDQLKSESIRASYLGSSSNSISQSHHNHQRKQQVLTLPVIDHHSDSDTSNFNIGAHHKNDLGDSLSEEEEEENIDISNNDYISGTGQNFNEVSVNTLKLIEENMQRQVKIVAKVDETVKELCAHIDMLVKENSSLKLKNSCPRYKVEITRSRSRISRVKDSILKKLLK